MCHPRGNSGDLSHSPPIKFSSSALKLTPMSLLTLSLVRSSLYIVLFTRKLRSLCQLCNTHSFLARQDISLVALGQYPALPRLPSPPFSKFGLIAAKLTKLWALSKHQRLACDGIRWTSNCIISMMFMFELDVVGSRLPIRGRFHPSWAFITDFKWPILRLHGTCK